MIISDKLYQRIQEKKNKLDSLRPLDNLKLSKLKKDFLVEYIYDSTSIEGNTLTLNETRIVLEEGITIGGKALREHLDITNQKEALEWIETIANEHVKLSESDILALHRITLKGISDYWAGKYKDSQNRILGSKFKTTPPYKVQREMNNLIHNLNKNPDTLNAIELAAYAHHELVKIHPFTDGNGRVARLLCNLILMRNGYPPIVIRVNDKKKYFTALEKAHFGNLKAFVDFIARREEESLIIYLNALTRTTKENELLPLAELVKDAKYSQEYLSLLARKGVLPSTKIEGVWHSSRKELKKYILNIGRA